jgi:hypothetical protein
VNSFSRAEASISTLGTVRESNRCRDEGRNRPSCFK